MAIVKVKYRDISYEQLREAHPFKGECTKEKWEAIRGKSVLIRVPCLDPLDVIPAVSGESLCGGPYYDEVGNSPSVTCPHETEIGD